MSTVAVGITFAVLMHPSTGLINRSLALIGIDGPQWLTSPSIALLSVALVDVWKGVGIALVIFIAGILSIPEEYFEAARLEGGAWVKFRHVILPLSRNATFTVILLSFIGGLRSFDLIWTMTRGGPGFSTDVIASTIYKQYQAGFYGLATAGNVHPVHRGHAARVPDDAVLQPPRDRAVRAVRFARSWALDVVSIAVVAIVFVVPFLFILFTAAKERAEAARFEFSLPGELGDARREPAGGHRRPQRAHGHGDAQQPAADGRLGDADRVPVGDGRLRAPASPRPAGRRS